MNPGSGVRARNVLAGGGLLLFLMVAFPLEAADPFDGAKLYAESCVHCHGATGRGSMPGAPDFSRPADPANGLIQGDKLLLNRIRRGGTTCPAFRPVYSDGQIMNIIAHIRRLQH
ncbi:MAG: cytochrome c [Magnetococcales bacterium]|nr:cytochrome c [Magnetococcales bacterium]MBF0151637.1 cytochrome c [Magnetococcales bacterium]MBF0171897.1 cytochrome c [Magnetococcales bacterium]MBF0632647.1 cytochrome c [Magnetococcales bacterium]